MKGIRWFLQGVLTCSAFAVVAVHAGAGDSQNGYPNNMERAVHALTNAVRLAPEQYRDKYLGVTGILLPATYPAVGPLYFDLALAQVARGHSIDMGDNCGMQHNSCDGTTFANRLKAVYPSAAMGENIAVSQKNGFLAVKAWLLDNVGGAAAADGSDNDGHRTNIMSSSYKELGVGFYNGMATGKLRTYWTQDFGSKTADVYPIPSGAFDEIVSGTFTFLASYYDAAGNAPKASKIVLNSVVTDLTLELGTAAKGTYMLHVPKGNGCMNYYFLFTDAAGKEWRYPETTTLSTVDGVVCDESAASIIRTGIKKAQGPLKLRYFDLLGRREN